MKVIVKGTRNWIKMDKKDLAEIRRQCKAEQSIPAKTVLTLLEALDELNGHFNRVHEEALLIDRNAAESQKSYERCIKELKSTSRSPIGKYILIYISDRMLGEIRWFDTLEAAQEVMHKEYEEVKKALLVEVEIPKDDIRFEIEARSAWINGGTLGYETEYHNDWFIREV